MPERKSADAQLERLLYVLPAAALSDHEDGALVADLAVALDVDANTLLADLQEATARAWYQPGGAVETFSLLVEADRVSVWSAHEFDRPVRLSVRESLALELGLRALAADVDQPRREEVLELAQRLGAALCAPETRTVQQQRDDDAEQVEYEPESMYLSIGDDGYRGVVAEAIEAGCTCTLMYLKAGAHAPEPRTVVPHRLVYADGRWYLLAHDLSCDECRIFRLDRALDVELGTEPAVPVPEPDFRELLRHGVPYQAHEEVEVVVRYSPRVAAWVQEHAEVELERDGSVLIRHHVADPGWIVRHVLQYGGEARVESPAYAKGWVRRALSGVA